ncbi:hypothetical protein UCREL1_5832 [Eutypa lata UCREL1]|uniref:Uncharacterized protein n=1 Tax=Eutypa lata (strain UCR-EL1) TaxID=1287681 RepID=M7SRR1_EUTLA|nr:hypothetical protein UCREL1_5832 [Eutypa lata UCREL1]
MPPINHAAMSAGLIAVSVAVAAAIAVYESPELQRMAQDLRRRIAIALHAFGDSISPQERENLFNRPEDAEGFLESRGLGAGAEPGVDADEETRRRQREELMYWNALREEKNREKTRGQQEEESEKVQEKEPSQQQRRDSSGSTFDDFLRRDDNGEKGSYVFNSGAEVRENEEGLLRRRGGGLVGRGLGYSNPFTDNHEIDSDIAFENSLMDPEKDEVMSDIYSATDLGQQDASRTATLSPPPAAAPALAMPTLIDIEAPTPAPQQQQYPEALSSSSQTERELGPDEYVTAGQDDRHDAYSSIQAWAQNSNASFYSPLPVSPMGPMSEPELVSDGILTPTDSGSIAGSGEDLGDDAASARSGGRFYDVMSDDEGTGMMTPASWTEVGSVVSESDAGAARAHS